MNKRSLTTIQSRPTPLSKLVSLVTLVSLVSLVFLASCERRPLEVVVEPKAKVIVEIDWMKRYGKIPNGMLMLIYDEADSLIQAKGPTNEVTRQELYLGVGTYRLTFVSYPDEETTYFPRLGNHYYANERSVQVRGHVYSYWETDRYKEAPEDIGATADTITITEEMVREGMQFVDYRDRDKYSANTLTYVFQEVTDPMTVTLYVRAKVKRRQSIKTIDASISGMADGFYLSRVVRTQEKATLLMPDHEWYREKYGEDRDSMGIITTQVATFGLPYGKELRAERTPEDNFLNFHVVLTNDSVIDLSYPVGHEIEVLSPGGKEVQIRRPEDLHDLRIVLDLSDVIVMPPTPATRTGAGFDAVVDEWEEGGTFDFGGF